MLFDTRPKTERKDFFDREREIEELKDVITHNDFAAVLGIRRIGKTSLVKVTLNELPDYVTLTINLGKLGSKKSYPMETFSKLFLEGAAEVIRKHTFAGKVSKIIANRLGINPEDILELNWIKIGVKLREFKTEDVDEVIRALDSIARDNKKGLVIFIDEVQNIKKVKGFDIGSFFHDIYEWCENTVVIVSGSFIGVAEEILNQVEEEKPFYGRKFFRIKLERFDEVKSKEFLRRGFEEENVKVDEKVIDEAVRLFDGIPGWLALFGRSYSYSVKHTHPIDIRVIVKEAAKQVSKEFTRFLSNSNSPKRYAEIILSLSRLGNKGSLSEIRDVMNSLYKESIGDSRLYELLKTLVAYGFVDKTSKGKYSLPNDLPSRLGLRHSAKMWVKKMP
ncbi:ATP-binding protein [Stygiolobus sp. CP850M]|uniref:AAA family ATPase n=1 Tax=Stygiolobus sp. CP850M TaxID=3133134 RepID=UPI00307E36AA